MVFFLTLSIKIIANQLNSKRYPLRCFSPQANWSQSFTTLKFLLVIWGKEIHFQWVRKSRFILWLCRSYSVARVSVMKGGRSGFVLHCWHMKLQHTIQTKSIIQPLCRLQVGWNFIILRSFYSCWIRSCAVAVRSR